MRQIDKLVSLIMPVANDEYIEESIKSICKQTYKKWELIILTCNCQKKVEGIINKISEPRIKYIPFEYKIGLMEIFNAGLSVAKGEYIARQDPDDISMPKRIELQLNYLEEHRNVGMVSCCIKSFTNERIYKNLCRNINKVQNFYKTWNSIDDAVIGGHIPIIFPTLMIRKTIFKNINILDKKMDFEDYGELFLNLLKATSVEKLGNILYKYRRHSQAYHILNKIKYKEYTRNILNSIDLKNCIIYREYRSEFISSNIQKIKVNKSSHLRVLMIVDRLNIGGTETYVLNVVKNLINMGVYVIVASFGGILEELFSCYGISIIRISNDIQSKVVEEIKEIIDKESINLIHCHLDKSMEIGKKVYEKYDIPYIITLHGVFYSKEILLSTCIKAKGVIAVSNPIWKLFMESVGNSFKGIAKIIANGVDTDIFSPNSQRTSIRKDLNIHENDFVIVYCSRLSLGKGFIVEKLLLSFRKLLFNYNNVHVIIIGSGNRKCIIEDIANDVNLSFNRDIVHVVGARYDVLSYYLESDLVIGTGRVALEALSCGKPVIAAGNKGCIGIVSPENKDQMWNSYFGDHEGSLEYYEETINEGIESLIKDTQRRLKLGRWSREWCIEKFYDKTLTREIVKLYNSILNYTNKEKSS
ncbi:glycosyltransferase [Clostridium muellerianum]|uniref:glycosyltransferase n=1 Tax=Clostridium muellerianum TaxID=2716538 RepID=UPI00315A51A1